MPPSPRRPTTFLWCSSTPGFGIRIYPSGKRVFVCQVRVGRATRRIKIGIFGPYTVEQARQRAQEIIRAASEGRDPQREKSDGRNAITVSELCDNYLEAARASLVMTRFRRPKRDATLKIDEGRIARHIKPLIGTLRARDVTRGDVQRMADAIAQGKTAGVFTGKPRGKAIVTGALGRPRAPLASWAVFTPGRRSEAWFPAQTPPTGSKRCMATQRADISALMSFRRLARCWRPMQPPLPGPVAALRLIALTGLRREEVCGLRWAEIDLRDLA